MVTDMTEGNPISILLKFTFPMLIGNLFQQLYNIVDSVVVGRFIGKNALASVGSSFMLMNFFSFVIIGLCMGASIVYSYYFGEKNHEKIRQSIFISFVFIGGFSIILSIVLFLTTDNMLALINTPLEIFQDSSRYLKIIFSGLFFVFLYNGSAAVLRSIGDSRTPLMFLILSAIINISLDLLFVIKFKMGVEGVAYATIIAQGVSSILCILYGLKKIPLIRIGKKDMVFNRTLMKELGKYSFLTSIQQSIMTFGMVCVQGVVNTFGSNTIAAFASAGKIESIAYLPLQDFGNAFGTYVAQNKGAKKFKRIKDGVRSAIKVILIFGITMSILVNLSASKLMTIFLDGTEIQVIEIGVEYLKILSTFFIFIGFLFMFYGYFRGIGALNISLILTIISLGTRVFIAYTFSQIEEVGRLAIWWATPIGWILADFSGFLFYRYINKKLNKNKGDIS